MIEAVLWLYIIQLLHAVMGSWRFVHPWGQVAPEGANGIRGEASDATCLASGATCPQGCTKPIDPKSQCALLFCYTLVT